MPKDPIRASRERAKAYEMQEARLRTEAARELPRIAQELFGETWTEMSEGQTRELLRSTIGKMRERLEDPVPDPMRGPEFSDLNTLNLPSRVLDLGMGALPDKYRPKDSPELFGLQAVDDVMMGKTPRLDDVGDLTNIGLTTAGAFLPHTRIAKGGKALYQATGPLRKKAAQSILGSSIGAGIAGFQQQRMERAQALIDQSAALQEKLAMGEAWSQAGNDVTFESQFLRAAGEAMMEGAGGSVFAFGPNIAKDSFARFAGITSDQAGRVIALLERYGIDPSVADVTDVSWIRRGADIMGKFPPVSKITAGATERRARQTGEAIRGSMEGIAPIITELRNMPGDATADRILKANLDAFNRIQGFYRAFKDEADKLYGAFTSAAKKHNALVMQSNTSARAVIAKLKLENLPKEDGKNVLPSGRLKQVHKVVRRLLSTEIGVPLEAFINRGREIEDIIKELPKGSHARAILVDLKVAMEADIKNNLQGPDEVLRLRDAADEYYHDGMLVLGGQAGQRFKRIDKSFGKVRMRDLTPGEISAMGIEDPGSMSPNRVISTLLDNANDVGVVRNLYELLTRGDRRIGKLHFREAVAVSLDQKFKAARKPPNKDLGIDIEITDVAKLRSSLGLDAKGGDKYNATREMLKLSGVDIDEFDQVLTLANAFWDGKVPDVSTFIARRAVLGGLGSLTRSFAPGVSRGPNENFWSSAIPNIASTAATMLLLRGATRQLVDPNILKQYRILLDPKKSNRAHTTAIMRLIALDSSFLVLENVGINPMDTIQGGVSMGIGDRVNLQRNEERNSLESFRGVVYGPLPSGRE